MKLNQLRAFRELMLTGSVSSAARNLNRTQPSISSLISSLESELEVSLFERRGGRLHPFPEAHYLFEECQRVLGLLDSISSNMRQYKLGESGTLRIAAMPGPSFVLLPKLISRFVQERKGVKTSLISRSSESVIRLIESQRFDIGVADYDDEVPSDIGLIDIQVFSYSCLCAVHKNHPLSGKRVIKLDDLKNQPLATLPDEHIVSQRTRLAFSDAALPINVVFTCQYFISLLTYVENQLACAIVDPMTIESHKLSNNGSSGNIVFKPLATPIKFDVALMQPKHYQQSVVARYFARELYDELKRLGPTDIV